MVVLSINNAIDFFKATIGNKCSLHKLISKGIWVVTTVQNDGRMWYIGLGQVMCPTAVY